MSEQPKDQNSPKKDEPARLDPASASAALALVVMSAERSSGKSRARPFRLLLLQALGSAGARRHAAQAAALAIAVGLGWAGGSKAFGPREAVSAQPAWTEAAGAGIRQNQDDIVRPADDMRALKGAVESFKESFEQARIEAAAQNRSLLERVETVERAGRDSAAAILRVAQGSERAGSAAEIKLAAIGGRLDAIERQAPAAKPAPDAETDTTGSVPDAKAAKNRPAVGWVLREVFDGGAVVESRSGRLHEVTPGRALPSLGRVEAIERRGRIWVVVTANGVIAPPARWR
jgi:hypothetical protein